jgi:chromosome segregation ATPase
VKEMQINKIRAQLGEDRRQLLELSNVDKQLKEKRDVIHSKQKELMSLCAERAAMEEELTIPINIHRWTLLESSDPVRFEKLKRYQELQSDLNLVKLTKEVGDFQELITEKENQFSEMYSAMKRKPGLEVRERVDQWSAERKAEVADLTTMTRQLDMYRDVVKEYRRELADVQGELVDKRKKWLRQKQRDLKHRRELRDQQEALSALGIDIALN